MKYSLRSLMIVVGIAPPLLAAYYFILTGVIPIPVVVGWAIVVIAIQMAIDFPESSNAP
jgi:hypothetical protein